MRVPIGVTIFYAALPFLSDWKENIEEAEAESSYRSQQGQNDIWSSWLVFDNGKCFGS
jgi:hypothetical protein